MQPDAHGVNSSVKLLIWLEWAPQAGFEPATLRLTAGCSAVELLRNRMRQAARCVADRLFYRAVTHRVNCRAWPHTLESTLHVQPADEEESVKGTLKA